MPVLTGIFFFQLGSLLLLMMCPRFFFDLQNVVSQLYPIQTSRATTLTLTFVSNLGWLPWENIQVMVGSISVGEVSSLKLMFSLLLIVLLISSIRGSIRKSPSKFIRKPDTRNPETSKNRTFKWWVAFVESGKPVKAFSKCGQLSGQISVNVRNSEHSATESQFEPLE